jgi:radial spoke head protein 4/6
VPSFPPFPGTEKNLLRAILAQINGATSISPDGYFVTDEDDATIVKLADAEALAASFPKAASELKEAEAWKHHELEVNSIGRITALPPLTDESGEPIEPEEPVEVPEPLATAKPELWAMRVFPGGAGSASASCVVARSLAWPGAVAVSAGRRFLTVYVGSGLSHSSKSYSPPLPLPVLSEWAPAEDGADALLEQSDVRVDPTPPVAEVTEEE